MNARLAALQPYPFQRLAALIAGIQPPKHKPPIRLSIGEPQHAAPALVLDALAKNLTDFATYPTTRGSAALRQSAAAWATRRFHLEHQPLDPERQVLPVAGTREALFSIAQAVIDARGDSPPFVMMPNPFYQIYEGAALLAGARPYLLNTVEANRYRMDLTAVPETIWRQTQLVYICSPANPTGAVLTIQDWNHIIELSHRHDFVIAADECYSELYFDEAEPPPGILQAAAQSGSRDFRNCLAFHSLSKRSNLPGLRSGFVAGDATLLDPYFNYRTYHGCALPSPTQAASITAWGDETHVRENRRRYRAKFDAVLAELDGVLEVRRPDAGFYLWPRTPIDDETFARELYRRENVLVLPGSYLSRIVDGVDPGAGRFRMALVASIDECTEAARRVRNYVESL